jgi:GxxExxY protein
MKTENEISFILRDAIYKTYVALGPGLLESAYLAVLKHELIQQGLRVRSEVSVPLIYDGVFLEIGYRIDLLIEEKVIVEIKSVDAFAPVHFKQVITYLKLTGKKLGILVNFNTDNILKSIHRKVNGL